MRSNFMTSAWNRIWLAAVLYGAGIALPAVAAGLLEDEQVESADPQELSAEVQTLDAIGQGVALSLAECEAAGGAGSCDLAVSESELTRLAARLDTRITQVATRYSSTGEAALEDVAVGYSEVREEYTQYLDKLAELGPAAAADEDVFADEPLSGQDDAPPGEEQLEDLFSDTDEEL